MKRITVSPIILLLFCFFIHPVMLKGNTMISYLYMYGIPLIYLLFHANALRKLSLDQFVLLSIAVLLVFLSVAYPIIHGTNDYSYLRVSTYVFRKLLVYLFLEIVLVNKYKDNSSICHFMFYFSLTHAVYTVVTIIFVLFPTIEKFWFTLFRETIESEELLTSFGYTFRKGWQGFSGYEFTIYCTISCIFLLYLFCSKTSDYGLTKVQFGITFALSFLGNMFYGRSGLVMTIVTCGIGLLVWNRKSLFKILKFGFISLIAVGIIVYIGTHIRLFNNWYIWATSPIKNLLSSGSFKNASIQSTHDMIFVPEFKTILVGDGYYSVNGAYYMKTDSGIMRNILFWGMFGVILSYGITVVSLYKLKKYSVVLFIMLLLSFLAFEYKGLVYYDFLAISLAMSFMPNLKYYYYPAIDTFKLETYQI